MPKNHYGRDLYASRLVAGLCPRCGSTREAGSTNKRCRSCIAKSKAVAQRWGKRGGKDWNRNYNLRRYGIDLGEWNALLASQGGRCALCATDSPGTKGWQTDHCHDSGRVRAILCGPCNLGLGCFKDNTDLMARAIAYLQKHRGLIAV